MSEGIGTDIVSVSRIEALVRSRGRTFLERWFTDQEIAYCTAKAVPGRHLAARFAAKEAVIKAFPEPWDGPLPWRSIEILPEPRRGPRVRLSGALAEAGNRAGIRDIQISLSHCEEYATAVAVIRATGAPRDEGGPAGRAEDRK